MKFDLKKYNRIFTADFETSTEAWNVSSARVWLWDICTKDFAHKNGNDLDGFMRAVLCRPCNDLYGFRNLAYDGTYILSWLLSHGYTWTGADTDKMPKKSFSTVITDMGAHYAYTICTEERAHVTFFDTLKYVNMSIERSAKCYNLPIKKGCIDYDLVREVYRQPTAEELDYIHNDTEIDMWTIKLNMQEGAFKFTQAGNARAEFRKTMPKADYTAFFPEIDDYCDSYLRKAYAGGFTYANPKFQYKTIEKSVSLDINSMYPAQMLHALLPVGYPEPFTGKYKENAKFPLYVQRLKCVFELKKDGVPCIAKRRLPCASTELYLTSSNFEVRELTLASPDLELFLRNYDVFDLEYIDGYMFRAVKGEEITPEQAAQMSVDEVIEKDGKGSYFYKYLNKWRYIKEHEPSGTAKRDYAKRMQNALYGAMAVNPKRREAVPYLNDKGVLAYKAQQADDGKPMYLPSAIFITAWARYFLISCIEKVKDRFIYCDTDSLYLYGQELPQDFPIHKSLYGFFKVEHIISKIKVIGAKRYVYYGREPNEEEDRFYVTCCGADEPIKAQMTFENFEKGAIFDGKKGCKNVVGGKHIYQTTYKLGAV